MDLWKRLFLTSIAVIFLWIGTILYDVFCEQRRVEQRLELKSLSTSIDMTLLAQENENSISGIELEFQGIINGAGTLYFSYSDSLIYKSYQIVNDSININFRGDWYHDFVNISFKPEGKTSGNLKIKYHFL